MEIDRPFERAPPFPDEVVAGIAARPRRRLPSERSTERLSGDLEFRA